MICFLALDVLYNPCLQELICSAGGTVSPKIGRILQFNFGFSRFLLVQEWNMSNKQLSLRRGKLNSQFIVTARIDLSIFTKNFKFHSLLLLSLQ